MVQQTEIIVQKKNYTLRTWQTEDASDCFRLFIHVRLVLIYFYSSQSRKIKFKKNKEVGE